MSRRPPISPSGYQALYAGLGRRTMSGLLDAAFLLVIWSIFATITKGRWDATIFALFVLVYLVGLTVDGGTIGQRMLGLRVVRANGQRVGLWSAFARQAIGLPLSTACGGLGLVWMLDDVNRQAWHDRIGGTVVVRELPVFDGPPWRYDPPWRRPPGGE